MARILAKIKQSGTVVEPTLGRPKLLDVERADPTLRSPQCQFILLWLRNIWGQSNVDWDPTNREYTGAINVLRVSDVYQEFLAEGKLRGMAPSERTFRRIWDYWMATDRIRMRKKKNVSGKCTGQYYFNFNTSQH